MKKFISLLLAIIMMLSVFSMGVSAQSQPNNLILGDATLDGKVNVKDATSIQKYLAKLIEFTYDECLCADVDLNDVVSIKDATWIQKYSANYDCEYPIGGVIYEEDNDTNPPADVTTAATTVAETEVTTEADTVITTDVTDIITDTVETTAAANTDVTVQTTATVLTTSGVVATSEAEKTQPETTVIATVTDPAETTAAKETEPVTSTAAATTAQTTTEVLTTMTTPETKPVETTAEVIVPPVKVDTNITIYFSNNVKWSTVNAYLYNDKELTELKTWPGTPMVLEGTNDFGEQIYKLDVDVSRYNRIIFNNGKSQTMNCALTVASSGFFITSQTPKSAMQVGVYAYGTDDYGTKTTTTLKYPTGYNKKIEIWTPAGYNPSDKTKKYSVMYLLDGQNQFDDTDAYNGGWGSDEVVTALMKNGGEGIILVGIDNSTYRDNELTPDIGNVVPPYNSQGFENGTGERFASFVADTVVPYIEANYNVYTDTTHSAIVGSSSGGIEAFYIGMEHMDEFGLIGALSPAFMLFDKSDWTTYFAKFDFKNMSKLPRIYFYNGGGDALERELNPYARDMSQWMATLGYPKDRMTFVYDEKNAHNEAAWRNVMPEVVSWLYELQ